MTCVVTAPDCSACIEATGAAQECGGQRWPTGVELVTLGRWSCRAPTYVVIFSIGRVMVKFDEPGRQERHNMKNPMKLIFGVCGLAALTACAETTGGSSTGQMSVAPGSPPFVEGVFGASDAAVRACSDLLASQTSGDVRVVGSDSSDAAHGVYMRVGVSGAPWRCLVGADGSNPSTEFMGEEGFL